MKWSLIVACVATVVLFVPLHTRAVEYTFYTVDYLDRTSLYGISSESGTTLGFSGTWTAGSPTSFFEYDIGSDTITDISSALAGAGISGINTYSFARDINNAGNIVGDDGSRLDGNDFASHLEKQPDGT